jgi:hypothetical protein
MKNFLLFLFIYLTLVTWIDGAPYKTLKFNRFKKAMLRNKSKIDFPDLS